MSMYIKEFINKIKKESPYTLNVLVGSEDIQFSLQNNYLKDSVLSYVGNLRGKKLLIEIRHVFNLNNNFNRLEIHSPGKSTQITCFHFGTIGMTKGYKVVEINQVVKFSGQNGREINNKMKQDACEILKKEGLLVQEGKKVPRWHLGSYNTEDREWLYDQDTEGFLRNFIKVALIMAHFRGNRGITLKGIERANTKSVVNKNEFITNDEIYSRYPNLDNKQIIHPDIYNEIRQKCEEIGLAGEEFVIDYEKNRLKSVGREDLALKVKHVSKENCAAGYDILSFFEDGRDLYIECKTTSAKSTSFELSANEWEVAKRHRTQYYIYRVINIYDSPSLFLVKDPYQLYLENLISITPTAYKVKFI